MPDRNFEIQRDRTNVIDGGIVSVGNQARDFPAGQRSRALFLLS